MLSKTLGVSRRFNAIPDATDTLAEFSQLLFTLIVPHTDDFGRMTADPFSLKMSVLPASRRELPDFADALRVLHSVHLLTVYQHDSDIWLQVNKFEDHQTGLHKRTESRIPPPIPGSSDTFPEFPGNSRSRARAELNLTELKGRELNGSEQKIPDPINKLSCRAAASTTSIAAAPQMTPLNGPSKRPIYRGQRLTVFEWMLDDLGQMLGPSFADFGLDLFFDQLDKNAAAANVVLPKNQVWPWLQTQVLDEAKRRGFPIVSGNGEKRHKRDVRDAEAMERMRAIK